MKMRITFNVRSAVTAVTLLFAVAIPAHANIIVVTNTTDSGPGSLRQAIIGGVITHDQVQEIQDSGYAPGDGRESAIIADLPAGNYTAIVRGVNSTTGVALVEVYDLQ